MRYATFHLHSTLMGDEYSHTRCLDARHTAAVAMLYFKRPAGVATSAALSGPAAGAFVPEKHFRRNRVKCRRGRNHERRDERARRYLLPNILGGLVAPVTPAGPVRAASPYPSGDVGEHGPHHDWRNSRTLNACRTTAPIRRPLTRKNAPTPGR